MNNKNTFYTCPYCKEEYSDPVDLAHCILNCEARRKTEEEEKRKAKLAAEKAARYKEVIDAYENFEELRMKDVNDYDYFTFEHKGKGGSHDWFWKSIGLF